MKVLKRAGVAVGVLLGLVLIAIAVLHMPSVQMAVFSRIQDYLRAEYNIQIEAESFTYRLFPRVQVDIKNPRIFGGPENQQKFLTADNVRLFAPLSILWTSDRIVNKLQLQNPHADLDNPPHPKSQKKKEEGSFQIEEIEITGGRANFEKFQVDELRLKSSLKTNRLQISELVARSHGSELKASGSIETLDKLQYDLNFTFNGDASIVKDLAPDLPIVSGPISGSGKITGYGNNPEIRGALNAQALSVDKTSPFQLNGQYEIITAATARPYRVDLQFKDFPLIALRKYVPKASLVASFASGRLHYEGGTDPFAATGSINAVLQPGGEGNLPVAGSIVGNLSNGSLKLNPSNLAMHSSNASFWGTVTRDDLDLALRAKIGNPADLATFAPDLRKVPGSYYVEARIHGPFRNLKVDGNVTGTSPGMKVQAHGSFNTGSEQVQAVVRANFDGHALRRFNVNVAGNFDLESTIQGQLRSPKLEGRLLSTNLAYQGIQVGDARVDFKSDGKILNADAEIPDFETVINASYVWNSSRFIVDAKSTDLTSEKLKPLLPAAARDIQGTVTGTLHAEGNAKQWKDAKAQLQIQSAKLTSPMFPAGLDLTSQTQMENRVVKTDTHVSAEKATIDAVGTYSLEQNRYELSAQLNKIDVQQLQPFAPQLPPDLNGNFSGTLTASGNAKQWKNSQAELKFLDAFFKRNELEVRVKNDSTVLLKDRNLIADVNVSLPQGEFQVQGKLPIEGMAGADLRAVGNVDLKIASMFTDQVVLTGKADLDVRVQGNLKNPQVIGDIKSQNFTVDYPIQKLYLQGDSVTAHFSGQDLQLDLQGKLNEAPVQVQGVVPVTASRQGNIRVNLQSFPLQSIASADTNFSGTASFNLQAEGTGIKPENWNAETELKLENIRVGETAVDNATIRARLDKQRLTIDPLQIKAGESMNLSLSGEADLQSQNINTELKTELDLLFLRNFMPDFSGSGKIMVDMRATGNLKNPQMTGVITMDNGFIRVPEYPFVFEQIQLRAPFDKNRVVIEKLSARMGGGTIEGSGQFDLQNFKPANANVDLIAKGVRLNYPEDLHSQLDTNLKFTTAEKGYLLSGNVDIVRSSYTEDIDYRDRLVNSLLSQKRALAPVSDIQSLIRLDLNVKTIEDFRMRNNLARLRVTANLQVQGTPVEPRVSGRIQVRDGSLLYFRGNEFVVERGNVDFYGTRKINPEFDFQLFALVDNSTPPDPGEFAVDQYEVEINVRGTLEDLEETTVQSFPALDEQAIYSLLLTGGTSSTLSQGASVLFQEELASYFAGQLFFGAPQQIGKALGLSRFEIQPDLVSTEDDPSARLVVGKDITSHLAAIYSVSLSDSEDQTWILNYRLMRNFSFRFVDESDQGYSFGLRHSLRFGPGAASLRSRKLSGRRQIEKIDKVELQVNDVSVPYEDVFSKIDELQGANYDYWRINDQVLDLKSFLQDKGYLFPEVNFEEARPAPGKVHLKFQVSGRGQRSMVFNGYEPSKKRINKYKQWWREGFSEQPVLEQIRDDLLNELWHEKYLRARVEIKPEIQDDSGRYVFEITPNIQYLQITLHYPGAKQYSEQDLHNELLGLYGSTTDLDVDAFHRFRTLKDYIIALYVQKGFLDATVKQGKALYNDDGSAEREIIINEGEVSRIEDLEVSNGQTFPPDLMAKLKEGPGKNYSPNGVSEDLVTVADYYESNGYPKAEVDSEVIRHPGNPALLLRYNLKTGTQVRIGNIRIVGNNSTRRSVIQKRLTFHEGDLLVRGKLFESQRNLYRTRNFQLVKIEAQEGEEPGINDVTVEVTESRKYRTTYGIRYNTETDIEGEVVLQDSRVFGTSHNASLFTRINSLEQDFGFNYSIPPISKGLIRGLDWDYLISARYEREDHPTFLDRAITFSFQKQFRLFGPFVSLGEYRYERDRITAKENTGPFTFDETSTISELVGTFLADTRDEPINAKRGYFISLENGFAPSFLQGGELFQRFYYQFLYFKRIGKIVWANGFRTGFAFPDAELLIISERFFAGGSSTVRGFKLDTLGPKDPFAHEPLGGEGLLIINQEIRFPVYKWFGGVAFYDGGNVWVKANQISFSDLRHTYGLGLRLETPFGVARFDWGYNPDPLEGEAQNVFHFGFGQAF
jgi:outer membrane protein assembly complex protein YaeT